MAGSCGSSPRLPSESITCNIFSRISVAAVDDGDGSFPAKRDCPQAFHTEKNADTGCIHKDYMMIITLDPKGNPAKNRETLQNALDLGGIVRVQTAGTYEISGTLFIGSDTALEFDPGITIKRVDAEGKKPQRCPLGKRDVPSYRPDISNRYFSA